MEGGVTFDGTVLLSQCNSQEGLEGCLQQAFPAPGEHFPFISEEGPGQKGTHLLQWG